MTISEKINRLKQIPKIIAEKEEDRNRLASITPPDLNKVGFSASKDNSAEHKAISYVDDGEKIDLLKQEKSLLMCEIQEEIDTTIVGNDINTIDTRRILKAYYLDRHNLKYISNRVIFRSYSATKELFKQGCEALKIAFNNPQ